MVKLCPLLTQSPVYCDLVTFNNGLTAKLLYSLSGNVTADWLTRSKCPVSLEKHRSPGHLWLITELASRPEFNIRARNGTGDSRYQKIRFFKF